MSICVTVKKIENNGQHNKNIFITECTSLQNHEIK